MRPVAKARGTRGTRRRGVGDLPDVPARYLVDNSMVNLEQEVTVGHPVCAPGYGKNPWYMGVLDERKDTGPRRGRLSKDRGLC